MKLFNRCIRVVFPDPAIPTTRHAVGGGDVRGISTTRFLRGAVKIVLEDVLRVRMVYVAIYLNIDYASG
jgi:hypothetical protein